MEANPVSFDDPGYEHYGVREAEAGVRDPKETRGWRLLESV